jgi:hypothetical protein
MGALRKQWLQAKINRCTNSNFRNGYGSVSVSFAASHNIVDLDPVPKAFDASTIGSWQYTLLNPKAPYVVNQTPLAGSVVTQLTSLTLNFNVPVTGLNASDLLINGSPATNMSGF